MQSLTRRTPPPPAPLGPRPEKQALKSYGLNSLRANLKQVFPLNYAFCLLKSICYCHFLILNFTKFTCLNVLFILKETIREITSDRYAKMMIFEFTSV